MRLTGIRKRLRIATTTLPILLIAALGVASSRAARQAQPTPFELFQRMMPAIRHPRCTNCHGVVDPETGKNHGGGRISSNSKDSTHQECTSCHDDAKEWQLPVPEHFFAGRTDRQICSQIVDVLAGFSQAFIGHVTNDDQIKQAFLGLAAGARVPGGKNPDGSIDPPADPPTMQHEKFVELAKAWVNEGGAACTSEGTITVEELVNSVDTVVNTAAHTHIRTQTGTRNVLITGVDGRFTADISVNGTMVGISTQRVSTDRGLCTVVITIKKTYSGSTRGPARVVVKDTAFRIPQPVPPQTDYRIDVTLPKEKTQRTESTVIQDGCGIGLKADPGGTSIDEFDEWEFTLEGRVQDRRIQNRIGACSKSVKLDQVGETQPFSVAFCNRYGHMGNAVEPWLTNHGADNSLHDGSSIPFQINTTWNLRRR